MGLLPVFVDAQMPHGTAQAGAVCSFFESKFKALKMPLSHGFPGLAAIKAGAKQGEDAAVVCGGPGQAGGRLWRCWCE